MCQMLYLSRFNRSPWGNTSTEIQLQEREELSVHSSYLVAELPLSWYKFERSLNVCFLFQEVHRYLTNDNSTAPYEVYAFSTATLNDILSQFSELSIVKVIVGYISMVSNMLINSSLHILTVSYALVIYCQMKRCWIWGSLSRGDVCDKEFLHRLQ